MTTATEPTATRDLVAWAWSLTFADLPDEVVRAASRHLMDGVGTSLAAARLGHLAIARAGAEAFGETGMAAVLGSAGGASPAGAAFANGMLVHALDFDDTHGGALVHATAAVLPALIAVGGTRDVSGRDALVAAVAAYEVVIRLGSAIRHGFHRRGFHATSVCGVFAATLLIARLEGLSQEQAVHALGIAGSQAAGSLEFLSGDADTKTLHPGLAAASAVVAVRLAAAGATGPATILEGSRGLFAAYADTTVSRADLTADLGARWETTGITIKPYPVCQLSHASMEAAMDLHQANTPLSDIAEVLVELPDDAAAIVWEGAATAPRTGYEARFSLPWCVATMLRDDRMTLDHLAADRLGDPEVVALATRVRVTVTHPDVAAADAPGRVIVTYTDGTQVSGEVDVSRGGPRSPLSDAELTTKFSANVARDGADALARRWLHLQDEGGLAALIAGGPTYDAAPSS